MSDAPTTASAARGQDVAIGTLPHVIGDAHAAVLLVDLRDGTVVHANDVALQLAPGVTLPVGLDVWADAARLRDLDGAELTDTDHPLSRLGRREPVPGQGVSAARASELGESREPLWVVGVPMQGAPALEDFGIVVLLSIRSQDAGSAGSAGSEAGPHAGPHAGADAASIQGLADTARVDADDRAAEQLHQRAVLATGLSFTVADASDPELPLVWVNPAFTATTGYTFEEAVGHNCRFLQGPSTSRATVARIRERLQRCEAVTETLLNYRKDGLAFWNSVTMSPIRDAAGRVTHFVGVQTDVSGKVEADQVRDRALESARLARDEAQRATARLELLADVASSLSGELDALECRQRLLEVVVPALADMAVVFHVGDDGEVNDWGVAHRDPDLAPQSEAIAAEMPAALRAGGPLEVLLAGEPARLLTDLQSAEGRELKAGFVDDPGYLDDVDELRFDSTIVASLPGRRAVTDFLVLNRTLGRTPFDERDLALVVDLGRRAGLIFDNARLYQGQQHIAETLQRSLLPQLTGLARAELAARYLPGTTGAEVGGDFYDIAELADGSLCLVVGDVLGHDVMAAAAMGHLKGMLWALAHDVTLGPAQVLERVDALMALTPDAALASVMLARLTHVDDGWELRSSSAGHPPLAVRRPDGACELVEAVLGAGREQMLGLGPVGRTEHVVRIEGGSTLVAFTDGLVERRGSGIDAGLDRLLAELGRGPAPSTELCDHLVDRLVPADERSVEDDVALLVARLR